MSSVLALSKLYTLEDPRLAETMVRGDLIVPTSDRIMTRSKARQSTSTSRPYSMIPAPLLILTHIQDPDRYTMVPAPVKIVKLLIEELSSASGGNIHLDGSTAHVAARALGEADGSGADLRSKNGLGDDDVDDDADANDDDDEDDGDWEDVPSSSIDLGLAITKQQLMGGFGDGTNSIFSVTRQRDDETQAYLIDFFRDISCRNVGRFQEIYAGLGPKEQEKLQIVA